MKQNLLFIIAIIFLPICAFLGFWLYVLNSPAVLNDKGIVFYVKPGTGLHSFAAELAAQNVIVFPSLLTLYGHIQGNGGLKSGEYLFAKGSTPASILSQVVNGTGIAYHPFAIIPGWSFVQLRQALNQADGLKHMLKDTSDSALMSQLGSASASPEGEFYPETYNYTRGESDLVILKRAYDLMQNRLQDAWGKHATNLPYQSSYDILIVASLIEKEAYLNTEKPIIAGVIINRLRNNMLLQLDPTVVFGMGNKYAGKIHKSDLLADTVYNTYVHKGLPPTPIALPSQSSLDAAMQPQANNFFYFVARGDGSHQFSQNLIEHNAAVASIMKQNTFTKDLHMNDHLQDLLELNNVVGQVH